MKIRTFCLATTFALVVPALAVAQTPPASDPPVRPKAELNNNPTHCVPSRETVGQGSDVDVKKPSRKSLSRQLAQSNGVICPPPHIDQGMTKPAPPAGTMPVIPPPGSHGGNPHVQPK
jgi:hypothetical protein